MMFQYPCVKQVVWRTRHLVRLTLVLTLAFWFTSQGAAQAQDRIVLEIGKGMLLPQTSSIESIFVADTSIADATLSPTDSVFLYAKTAGETSLIGAALDGTELFRYTVVVTESLSELRRSLGRRFPGEAISVESSRGSMLITGIVSTEEVRENIIRTIQTAIPNLEILDEITVNASNLIRLQVRLLEVNRNRVGKFGINWNATVADNGYFIGAGSSGELAMGYDPEAKNSLNATIDLLVTNGIATIIQETSLSTVNGQDAEFSVGGEIPIPAFIGDTEVKNTGNFSLDYKFVGTRLIFTPTEAAGNKLRLSISSSVSSIQAKSSTVNGNVFPNISSRSFRTNVELNDGQSFVIAGLSRNESLAAVRDPRGNGTSRAVNSVFGRDTVDDTQQELVIVVTPILSDLVAAPVSDAVIKRPGNLEFILGGGTEGSGKAPGFGQVSQIAGFRY